MLPTNWLTDLGQRCPNQILFNISSVLQQKNGLRLPLIFDNPEHGQNIMMHLTVKELGRLQKVSKCIELAANPPILASVVKKPRRAPILATVVYVPESHRESRPIMVKFPR